MFFYVTPTSLKHNQVAVDRTILFAQDQSMSNIGNLNHS